MPRRVTMFMIALSIVATMCPGAATAARGDKRAGCTGGTDGTGTDIECTDPGSGSPEKTGIRTGPRCSYSALTPQGFFGTGPILLAPPAGGFEYVTHEDGAIGRRFPDGREEKGFTTVCGVSGGFAWVDTSITVQDLVGALRDRARQSAPAPVVDMNPAPDIGGIVNLGLWLAVEDVRPAPIRVEAGPLWAEAEMVISSMEWDMGNGDVVQCADVGVRIQDVVPDLNTVDEGPCGYTYRLSSPEDDPYVVTTTVSWSVTYRSSSGSGTIGDIERSSVFDYDVDEIQTLGMAN